MTQDERISKYHFMGRDNQSSTIVKCILSYVLRHDLIVRKLILNQSISLENIALKGVKDERRLYI